MLSCAGAKKAKQAEEELLHEADVKEVIKDYIEENPIYGLLISYNYYQNEVLNKTQFDEYMVSLMEEIKQRARQYYLAEKYQDALIYNDAYEKFNKLYNDNLTLHGEDNSSMVFDKKVLFTKHFWKAHKDNNYPKMQKIGLEIYQEYPEVFEEEKMIDTIQENLKLYGDQKLIAVLCEDDVLDDTYCKDPEEPDIEDMLNNTFTIHVDGGYTTRGIEKEVGSSFFISSDGYALTNYHIIRKHVDPEYKGKAELSAKLNEDKFGGQEVEVIGYDPLVDLALVKVKDTSVEKMFHVVDEENMNARDKITVIGSPLGLSNTVTSGIISTKKRVGLLNVGNVLQIDASVNPGNSGGPLIDDITKDVVGVVVAKIQGVENINFAIPGKIVKSVLPSLFENGKVIHGWLGIGGYMSEKGFEVVYIAPDSSARYSDLRIGDIITAIDGEAIDELDAMQINFLDRKPSEMVAIDIITEEGKKNSLVLVTTERRDKIIESNVSKGSFYKLFPVLTGTQIKVTSSGIRPQYRITKVYEDSYAKFVGMSKGDILEIRRMLYDREQEIMIVELKTIQTQRAFLHDLIAIQLSVSTRNFL